MWLSAGDLSFLGLLARGLSSTHGSWNPPEPLIQERGQNGKQAESHSAIYDLVLEVVCMIAAVFHGHTDQPGMI